MTNQPKPTKSDIAAAVEWFDGKESPEMQFAIQGLSKLIARHMEPERALLRELAEMNCFIPFGVVCNVHALGEYACIVCRARKLMEGGMTTDLFPEDKALSPKLRWMEKHGVKIELLEEYGSKATSELYPHYGYGMNNDSAIEDWARMNGVRLWNEDAV